MPSLKTVAFATITLYKINEIALYNAEIVSTNGNIFHPYDIDTTLMFRVYKNSEDITDNINDIEWKKFSFDSNNVLEDHSWGFPFKNETSVSIDKNSFNQKCVIQADAYDIIDNIRTCVASARITLIDVNEIYTGATPPENPIDGMLWVNKNGDVPVIYSWNDSIKEWKMVGKTDPVVRNLILNSNFWKQNDSDFTIENSRYLYSTITTSKFEKQWIRLKTNKKTSNQLEIAGICQTTSYPIIKDSYYTLSFKAYNNTDREYTGKNVSVKIISINNNGIQTEILSALKNIPEDYNEQISCTFKSLNDTKNIKVIIGIEPMIMCDFYITEISLYNTNRSYPWELAPEDLKSQIDLKLDSDHMSVFNALTKNGSMEGLYIGYDSEGKAHYFFNASHIKAGSIDGGLINGIGLNIKDEKTGNSIFHVYSDEDGTHIDMIAQNLYIGTEPASTKKYADDQAAQAESNAAGYTNTTVATNRADSERILNGNIATTATNVKKEMTDYIDDRIIDTILNNENYTDNSVGNAESNISNAMIALKNELKKYTDDKVKKLSDSSDGSFEEMNNSLSQTKQEAISTSKEYTDEQIAQVNTTINNNKTDITDYINGQVKVLTNNINNKADESTVSGINTRLTEAEIKLVPANIASTVTSSESFTNILNTKVDTSSFNSYTSGMLETINTINSNISARVESKHVIESINNSEEDLRISKNKIDLSIYGTDEEPISISYNETIYSGKNMVATPIDNPVSITVDNFVNNLNFYEKEDSLLLDLDVSKVIDTEYVKSDDGNSHIYIDNHEIIKLLLYETKNLKKEIEDLKEEVKKLKEIHNSGSEDSGDDNPEDN